MAAGGGDHAGSCSRNDAASSQPLTEEETTTATATATSNAKRLQFTILAPTTLQQQSPKPPSLPGNSLHAQSLDAIPFDLITEILSRLPVKSLLRFRCVCKSWNALISDSQFAKKQFRASAMGLGLGPTHSARHHLIVSYKRSKRKNASRRLLLTDYSLPSVPNSSNSTSSRRKCPYGEGEFFRFLAGSCHGMLCLATDKSCPLLWNPSTGKFKHLPSLKPKCVKYGFGYDHFSDSYKVVAVVLIVGVDGGHIVDGTEVKVHTLGTDDSWRAIHGFPATVAFGSGKFVSGTLNFLARDVTHSLWVIASLDLRTETFQQLLLPPDYGADVKVSLTLAVLKGCLCIIAHCNMVSDILLMKDYGNKESWTKLFSFPYLEGYPKYHPELTRVLYISDEDDEVLLEHRSNFIVYNSKSGTFKTHGIQKFRAPIVAAVYDESLISPCC